MFSYIIRRLLLLIPTVFVAVSFLFFLFYVLPGDPARLIAGGTQKSVPPEVIAEVKERYGLNDPLLTQFVDYWKGVLQWDLGDSYTTNTSVNEILGEAAPRSIRLGLWAVLIEIVVGITVGVISAVKRYSLLDKVTTFVTTAGAAIPAFVLGFLLQYAFAVYPFEHDSKLSLFGLKIPWPQFLQFEVQGPGPDTYFLFIPTGDQWNFLVLPAITLACVSTALAARMTRGSMLEVVRADYMRTARAKGLSEGQTIRRHGLRNAMLPVVTLIGIDLGTVIGAAILTETVFGWQGLGWNIADAIGLRDLPRLLGLSLVVVFVYALVNLLVDLSYAWFDPRIRLGGGGT